MQQANIFDSLDDKDKFLKNPNINKMGKRNKKKKSTKSIEEIEPKI